MVFSCRKNAPTLAFLRKKAREPPKKTRVFLFTEPLKSLEKTRRVPPCAVKTWAVRPVFARVADPSNVSKGPCSKMLAQGNNPRLRDQGGSRGRSRTQDQKTRTVSTCWSNPEGMSLEKKGKPAQQSKENRKTKKARKSKKTRIGGSGALTA